MSRTRARRALATVLLIGAVLVAALLTGTRLDGPSDGTVEVGDAPADGFGDLDRDGKITTTERDDLDVTLATQRLLEQKVFPTKGIFGMLLTPSGENWWALVISYAAELEAGETPPPGAKWYAVSAGRSYRPVDDGYEQYRAVHLKFSDTTVAQAWREEIYAKGENSNYQIIVRGRGIVTLAPKWVRPEAEPLPLVDEFDADLDELKVGSALWQIDFAEQIAVESDSAPDPQRLQEFYNALGFADGTTWKATASAPDDAWTGRLNGYDADDVKPFEALAAINLAGLECEGGPDSAECRRSIAQRDAVQHMFLSWIQDGSNQTAGNRAWIDPAAPDPASVDLYFARSAFFDPFIAGRAQYFYPPSPYQTWYVSDGLLTIHPFIGPLPQGV